MTTKELLEWSRTPFVRSFLCSRYSHFSAELSWKRLAGSRLSVHSHESTLILREWAKELYTSRNVSSKFVVPVGRKRPGRIIASTEMLAALVVDRKRHCLERRGNSYLKARNFWWPARNCNSGEPWGTVVSWSTCSLVTSFCMCLMWGQPGWVASNFAGLIIVNDFTVVRILTFLILSVR